jgi:hypothetical protein
MTMTPDQFTWWAWPLCLEATAVSGHCPGTSCNSYDRNEIHRAVSNQVSNKRNEPGNASVGKLGDRREGN